MASNARNDQMVTRVMPEEKIDLAAIAEIYAGLESDAVAQLEEDGIARDRIRLVREADLRYAGQSMEVRVVAGIAAGERRMGPRHEDAARGADVGQVRTQHLRIAEAVLGESFAAQVELEAIIAAADARQRRLLRQGDEREARGLDVGEAAAAALLARDFQGKEIRELHGQRDLTWNEVAAVVGRVVGKPGLRYVRVPFEEAQKGFVQMGVSPSVAAAYIEMYQAVDDGRLRSLEPRSHRNTTPTSIEQFATALEAALRS